MGTFSACSGVATADPCPVRTLAFLRVTHELLAGLAGRDHPLATAGRTNQAAAFRDLLLFEREQSICRHELPGFQCEGFEPSDESLIFVATIVAGENICFDAIWLFSRSLTIDMNRGHRIKWRGKQGLVVQVVKPRRSNLRGLIRVVRSKQIRRDAKQTDQADRARDDPRGFLILMDEAAQFHEGT